MADTSVSGNDLEVSDMELNRKPSSKFLPDVISCLSDRERLLEYLSSSEGPKFLDDTESNNCLFFEIPAEGSVKEVNDLCGKGVFSEDRWGMVDEIHVVFPLEVSTSGHTINQAYIARSAFLPHYQGMFHTFLAALLQFESNLKVFLYNPRRDHANHFMVVMNSRLEESLSGLSGWDGLAVLVKQEQTRKKCKFGTLRQTASQFVDYGFTSTPKMEWPVQ